MYILEYYFSFFKQISIFIYKTSKQYYLPIGNLTEWLTVFARKGGKVMRRVGSDHSEFGKTAPHLASSIDIVESSFPF